MNGEISWVEPTYHAVHNMLTHPAGDPQSPATSHPATRRKENWRIRLTSELRGMLTDTAPDGWVPLGYASQALGISRQTASQKVKRGELNAGLTRTGRRKGLRIEIPWPQDGLFYVTGTISKRAV